ncbi:MAG: pitrilysin family protein, partial [Planctomycetota bacterium]|nr:pitrilysin family protein [Planctomycetota bacterium]
MTPRAQTDAEIPAEAMQLIDEAHRRVCVLTNGMTVIAQRHEAAPLVASRVYVRGGSAFEAEYAGAGISHLLEHVVTGDAAGKRTEREIGELSEAIGGLINAYTCDDHICYHATSRREHLQTAVELLADWTARPALSDRVFDRELGIVQRELERDRDEPDTQLDELIHEVMYPRHPVRYPIIGHRESLMRLTARDLANYHARTHVPDNVVVVLVGDLDIERALPAVCRAFAGFERRAVDMNPLPRPLSITAPRRMVKNMDVASASMAIAWQTVREGHLDDVPLDLLCSVLTHGNNARLVKKLRWDLGLAFDVGGTHETMWHTAGTFEITAQLAPGCLEDLERALLKAIAELDKCPITDEELGRAVRQCTTPLEKQRQTAEGLAAQLGEDFLASGDVNYTDTYIARMARATAPDLARV